MLLIDWGTTISKLFESLQYCSLKQGINEGLVYFQPNAQLIISQVLDQSPLSISFAITLNTIYYSSSRYQSYSLIIQIINIPIAQMGNHQRALTQEEKQKLASGKPVLFSDGVKIVKNPKTGKLEGVPEQWMKNNNINLPFEVDRQKTQKTNHFPTQIRPQYELPESIKKLINAKPLQLIFGNKDAEHQKPKKQLQFDPQHQYGIKNLPNEWVQKLNSSKISPQDVRSDPKGTIEMIENFEDDLRQSNIESSLITNKQFETLVEQVKFIQDNPAIQFVFDKELGKGAMCKVFYCYDRKPQTRKQYACRIIKLNDPKTLGKIKTEIAVMKLCHEKNLVNYYFSYYYKESLFMFIQFMNAGALTDFVYHYMKKIPQQIIAYIAREILLGLQALHDQRQLHRDLKSDNILVSLNGDIKIADFGFAMQLTKERLNRKSVVGTPAWMPPELIKKEQYNEKVDIWSLGIVVIELCNGQPPFLRLPHLKAMHNIVSKDPPRVKGFSIELCNFVQNCLQKNPKERLNCHQLLNHKFIRNIGNGKQQKAQFSKYLYKMKKNGAVQLQP